MNSEIKNHIVKKDNKVTGQETVKSNKDIYTSVRWDSTDLLSFFKTLGFQRSDFISLHKSLE